MKKNSVMVFIEQNENNIADVSLELLSKARDLAEKLSVPVEAVTLGHQLQGQLDKLGHYGCDTVYYVDDKRLARFSSVPYAKMIAEVIRKHEPQIVLYGASTTGRDVAPRVSAMLQCGLTADCTELEIGEYTYRKQVWDNTLLQIRPAFGGNIIATIVSPESTPSMATVREGVMKMNEPDTSRKVKIVEEPCALEGKDFPTKILEQAREELTVHLKSARIIVAAGIGVSTPETVELVKSLARTIGGEVGCTRAVVDAGLLSYEHQIGQTGVTVRPNLYIACGISGQIQHRAGMDESMRIVAINKDPKAPIFEIAHYGIVGDVTDVIPKMINAYKAKA